VILHKEICLKFGIVNTLFIYSIWRNKNGTSSFSNGKAELHDVTGCDVAIAPPVMYLGTAEAALSGCGCSCGGKSVIQLGAQNVDINVKGAFTGDISSEMLKDFASYLPQRKR